MDLTPPALICQLQLLLRHVCTPCQALAWPGRSLHRHLLAAHKLLCTLTMCALKPAGLS